LLLVLSGHTMAGALYIYEMSSASESSYGGAGLAEFIAFTLAFGARAAAIVFDLRMGPPGEFITIGGRPAENRTD